MRQIIDGFEGPSLAFSTMATNKVPTDETNVVSSNYWQHHHDVNGTHNSRIDTSDVRGESSITSENCPTSSNAIDPRNLKEPIWYDENPK